MLMAYVPSFSNLRRVRACVVVKQANLVKNQLISLVHIPYGKCFYDFDCKCNNPSTHDQMVIRQT